MKKYEMLVNKKIELQKTYKNAQKEVRDVEKRLDNVQPYVNLESTPEISIFHTQQHSV